MIALNPEYPPCLSDRFRNRVALGWRKSGQSPFGFALNPPDVEAADELIEYSGDGHLLTVGPTGTGKGRSVMIPTLLTNPRTMIVLDVKGELHAVTSRRRRELGHTVVTLDPFGLVTACSDGLNPFDLFSLPGVDVDTEAETLAALLTAGNVSTRERFWDIHGSGLLAGIIAHVASGEPPERRHILTVRDLLMGDDPIYQLAALMDSGKVVSPLAKREIASFLNQAERDTRPSVLATTTSYLKPLGSNQIGPTVCRSAFRLEQLIAGEPLTIYVVCPLDKLGSHKGLIRLLIGTLLAAVLRRRSAPELRTLFLLDECAQLGKFELLKPAVTLCRGFGLQCWMLFQSLWQLKDTYPEEWRSFLDNVAVVQAFGFSNPWMADDWGWFFDRPPASLLQLPAEDQLLYLPQRGVVQSQKFDYLADPLFAGHFDPNPLCERGPRRRLGPGTDGEPRPSPDRGDCL